MLGYSTLAPNIYTTLSVDVADYREPRAAGVDDKSDSAHHVEKV